MSHHYETVGLAEGGRTDHLQVNTFDMTGPKDPSDPLAIPPQSDGLCGYVFYDLLITRNRFEHGGGQRESVAKALYEYRGSADSIRARTEDDAVRYPFVFHQPGWYMLVINQTWYRPTIVCFCLKTTRLDLITKAIGSLLISRPTTSAPSPILPKTHSSPRTSSRSPLSPLPDPSRLIRDRPIPSLPRCLSRRRAVSRSIRASWAAVLNWA